MRLKTLCLIVTSFSLLTACKPTIVTPEDQSYASTSAIGVDPSEAPLATAQPTLAPTNIDIKTCRAEIGELEAVKLVERCKAVSPATHPPCHADNACNLIQSEIDRSCAMYGPTETKPSQCNG